MDSSGNEVQQVTSQRLNKIISSKCSVFSLCNQHGRKTNRGQGFICRLKQEIRNVHLYQNEGRKADHCSVILITKECLCYLKVTYF